MKMESNRNLQNQLNLTQKRATTTLFQQKNDKSTSSLNTDQLDDAVKELLDICQLYNEKVSVSKENTNKFNDENKINSMSSKLSNTSNQSNKCDISQDNDDTQLFQEAERKTTKSIDEGEVTIERLQKKQTDLQAQLDEVLRIAKRLDAKQKRSKLQCIIEDEEHGDEEENDEDELIEFQQIENELRVSEINRQLDNIQEELRIRLYKRLLSNTNNAIKSSVNSNNNHHHMRRGSQTDESSPSSSSCSEEPTTASSISILTDINPSKEKTSDDYSHPPKQEVCNKNDQSKVINNNQAQIVQSKPLPAKNSFQSTNLDHDYSAFATTATTSKEKSSNPLDPIPLQIPSNQSYFTHQIVNYRNSSANSDLERIEEDEEDGIDYYATSDHFRTIYEEKLSPILRGEIQDHDETVMLEDKSDYYKFPRKTYDMDYLNDVSRINCQTGEESCGLVMKNPTNLPENDNSSSFNSTSRQSFTETLVSCESRTNSKSNRPLTLYLPKPNEEVDLLDHIQALGHDLNIISDDLKLDTTNAQGYLWKSCSNNSKRWLKRYFYFDRASKALYYYDNKSNLVKRHASSANNCIPFDEISDVYVDHKLSVMAEKNKSAKRRHFVFVLATTRRKYLLSAPKAEIMRAWIDILFTAAKADDYLEQLEDGGENSLNSNCLNSNLP